MSVILCRNEQLFLLQLLLHCTDRFEKRTNSGEDNIETIKKLHPDKVITSRDCQKGTHL